MNKYFASLLYLLLSILISCTFQPEDEDYFNKIEKTLPKTLINLNNYTSEDTIFIYTATSLQFDVSSDRGQFLEAKVLLGSRELFSGSKPKGSFTIDAQQFKTGIYKLRIQFLNSSGTGSLLDALGGEIVEAWQEWIVQIDFDLPPTPQIIFSEENGFLKVSWTRYTKSNFKSYEVFAQGPGVYKRFTILNPQKNYWIDSLYLMGPSSYAITVNSNLGGTSIQKSINNSVQFTMLYRHQDSTAILRWRKLPIIERLDTTR